MEQIELRIPKTIESLVAGERDRLLRSALRVAAKQRTRELEKERREAIGHIRRFKRKYNVSLSVFEKKTLRTLNTVQAHEDFNDWFFWARVLKRADQATAALKKMESVK